MRHEILTCDHCRHTTEELNDQTWLVVEVAPWRSDQWLQVKGNRTDFCSWNCFYEFVGKRKIAAWDSWLEKDFITWPDGRTEDFFKVERIQ